MPAIWAAALTATAARGVLALWDWCHGERRQGRIPPIAVVVAAAWAIIAIGSLIDIQLGDRLYFSPTIHDYSVRAPITAAISRDGVLPRSPLFFPGAAVPLRYHYFWYILCGAVQNIAGGVISPRHALIAGTVWCGFGLMAIIPLYLRFFYCKGSDAIRRRSTIGIALLAVTGLDLIPVLFLMKVGNHVQADLDWWNEEVASWFHSVLWVPHHVVAMIACLTGFLLLWRPERGPRITYSIVIASFAFMTAIGCSVYVMLIFVIFLGLWTSGLFVAKRHREGLALSCAGIFTAVLSLPHLLTLVPENTMAVAAIGRGGPSLFTLSVRSFTWAEILVKSSYPDRKWLVQLVNAVFLPLNYFLEFGFFFFIGYMVLKRYYRSTQISREQSALATLLGTSMLVCTFVRSSVIVFNDLGWRGLLFAQFVLILWSVEFWPSWANSHNNVRPWLRITLLVGVAGTIYQGIMLRGFPILIDRGSIAKHDWISPDRQLGRRTMAVRQAYVELESMLPHDAVVQFNPMNEIGGYMYGNYADWQTAAFDPTCGAQFGGNRLDCARILSDLSRPFEDTGATRLVGRREITALIFQEGDPIWSNRDAWIWKIQPLFANRYIRIMRTTELTFEMTGGSGRAGLAVETAA